ncbi:hypothetical protein BAZOLSSOX_1982, partial [uncultured Gammaproteobacteria bacterium]
SSTTIKYSADGKFPIKTTNALGHFETKTFDAKTGNILTLKGPNGLSTTWKYDSLGRKTLERRADGTTTKVHYQWVENEPQDILYENGSPNSLYKNEPQNSLYQVTTTTSGSSPKTTYFDAFNRTLREQHTGFDGRKINNDTYYDNLGRVQRASLPYFVDEQSYFVTTQYDAIGRLTSTTKPADNGKTATSSTTYNGFTTTTTNPLGHQKTTTKNAIGKIIRIDEPKSAWLTHHYNSIGNLIKTVVGGVTTTMKYDIRGNKIKMNDPDMGTWTYAYNALGKLISQTDAKGQTSTMTYDKLGRMTQRVEAEGTSTWTYDTKSNGIGKLSVVKGPNGYKKELSYDAFGRVSSTTLTTNGEKLTTTNTYDSYSRLSIQTRPQKFKVENVYNQYGYLLAKRAPKSQISDYDWDHLTKLTKDSLANASEALTKVQELEQQTHRLVSRANSARKIANHSSLTSAELAQKAQELRDNAEKLDEIAEILQLKAEYYKALAESYLTAIRRFQHLSNVNVADDEERSYTDSTTNSNIDRDLDFDSTVTSNINGYAWCSNKAACVLWATVSKNKAKFYKALAEKSLESAQQYLDSSGSEKQAFANQEADKLDSESNNKDDATPTKKPHISYHFANEATKYLKQAQASASQTKH